MKVNPKHRLDNAQCFDVLEEIYYYLGGDDYNAAKNPAIKLLEDVFYYFSADEKTAVLEDLIATYDLDADPEITPDDNSYIEDGYSDFITKVTGVKSRK